MWHTHCATVRRTSQQLSQLFCALGTKVSWRKHKSEQKTTFVFYKCMASLKWDSSGVLSAGLVHRESWFAILHGQGQWHTILSWVNSCSVFLPLPWLFTWASQYFLSLMRYFITFNECGFSKSCDIRKEVLSVSCVWGLGHCFALWLAEMWCHPCVDRRNILSDIKKYKRAVPTSTKLIKLLGFFKSILIIYCSKQYRISFPHFSQLLIS